MALSHLIPNRRLIPSHSCRLDVRCQCGSGPLHSPRFPPAGCVDHASEPHPGEPSTHGHPSASGPPISPGADSLPGPFPLLRGLLLPVRGQHINAHKRSYQSSFRRLLFEESYPSYFFYSSRAMIGSDHGPFHFRVLAHSPAKATIFMTSVSVCAQHGQ